MSMIKAILFDWHGVLDKVTYEGFLNEAARRFYYYPGHKLSYDNPLTAFETIKEVIVGTSIGKIGADYTRGIISPEDFWDKVHKTFPLFWNNLEDYLLRVDLNERVWGLMQQLSNNYKLALVSDVPADKAVLVTRAIAEQQTRIGISKTPIEFNFASNTGNEINSSGQLFDPIIYSYNYRRLKVEENQPSLYRRAASMLRLSPQECRVVDDSIRNIECAKREGFETLHYKNDAHSLMSLMDGIY